MLTYTYISKWQFGLMVAPRATIQHERDVIVKMTLETEPLITHTYPLSKIDEAYELFENKRDGVIKVAVKC